MQEKLLIYSTHLSQWAQLNIFRRQVFPGYQLYKIKRKNTPQKKPKSLRQRKWP